MRYIITIIFLFFLGSTLSGQEGQEGEVSYITSQHVYVKFSSMEGISEGDTLYFKKGDKEVPVLQVKNLSSMSCVCIPLLSSGFKVGASIYAKLDAHDPKEANVELVAPDTLLISESLVSDDPSPHSVDNSKFKQDISGRISLSSYSNFYNDQVPMSQRMRYTFSLNADNIGNSKLSAESYLSFSHSNANWDEVKENIFAGLKVYNLSASYAFSESMYLSFGRKINPKLSSVGAIDGLQFEKKFKALTVGAFLGLRPDYVDYVVNTDLLQYGVYLGHELAKKNGSMQSTLAFIEQTNQSQTDRRFLYFQHTNMLVKNLFFFGSAEVDLYKKVDDAKENVFELTNTYLSLRYRIIRPLSLGLSFSARQNIIYYETYKDFVDRLLDAETLQGWRFRITYRPAKYLFLGVNAGYRYRKEDPQATKNLNGYLTYSRVPGIGASITLTTTWLETSYINGIVYGAGISRKIISDKLSGGLKYRYVDYLYRNAETPLIQNVGEINLSWAVYGKLSLSVYYEGTFEKETPYHRLYINLSQRF